MSENDRPDQPDPPNHELSRRELLRQAALAAAMAGLGAAALDAVAQRLLAQASSSSAKAPPSQPPADQPAARSSTNQPSGNPPAAKLSAPAKSRVVVVTHPEILVRGYEANRQVMEKIIEAALAELYGVESVDQAWRTLAADGERVSMKTTRAGGPNLRTHDEIGNFVARKLAEVSKIDPARIRIWDRPDLKAADLELSEPYVLPSSGKATRLRSVLVRDVSAIINLPVLKMHSGTGASLAMKNHFGSINNPAAFHGWERGEMWKSIAELSNLEPIRRRTRLVIVDATRPLYNGGPADDEKFRWNFNGLIFGTDPVAVESVGLDLLEKKREEVRREPWPATDARRVIDWAAQLGLGHADRSRIDLLRVDLT